MSSDLLSDSEAADRRAKMRARADERRAQFREAEAHVPEPTESTRDAILAALAAEGFNKGVRLNPSTRMHPTADLRSLLHDWRTLRWVNEHYPKEPSHGQ